MLGGHLRHYNTNSHNWKTTFIRRRISMTNTQFFTQLEFLGKDDIYQNDGVSPEHHTNDIIFSTGRSRTEYYNSHSCSQFYWFRFDSDSRDKYNFFTFLSLRIISVAVRFRPKFSYNPVVRFHLTTQFALNFFLYRHAN